MASGTSCLNDDAFGPSVRGCRGDFDFTQKFERIFLAILPASIFIALALARIAMLIQKPRIVSGVVFQYTKLIFLTIYSTILFAWLVVLSTGAPGVVHGLSITAGALLFLSSLFLIALSHVEHARSCRPSALIGLYIFLTLLFDIVQTRTSWLARANLYDGAVVRLLTASVAIKAVILCLEAAPKTRWIRWDAAEHSPEESSSVFSLGVYFWLNKLFFRGYRDVLTVDDLYPLDPSMGADTLYAKLSSKWRLHKYRDEPKLGLVKDLGRALAGPFLMPVAPRVAMIGFKFCQPFFIEAMLTYLGDTSESRRDSLGYGLIGASVIIYTGIAISQAFYDYYSQRSIYMARGALVAAIYRKTTAMKLNAADDSAAITLMSTDIERIIRGLSALHELWANLIEVALASWLLEEKLGVAFIAPTGVIIASAVALLAVLRRVGRRQAEWMARIQNRVGLTANAISNMKLYKISGMTGPVSELIQGLRVTELKVGNGFRMLLIFAAMLGFVPMCFGPVLAFAAALGSLGVSTLFTSMTYILLLTTPLISMFQQTPGFLAGLTCMQRIQKFIITEPRTDFRHFAIPSSAASPRAAGDGEKTAQISEKPIVHSDLAFTVEQGTFGWGGEKNTLTRISAKIPSRQLTLVVGPVASGKSTFCKVLLGEMPTYDGKVTTYFPRSQIGYCEQTPFLFNATLRENIIGHCLFNQQKYDEVVAATLLALDATLLPQGHDTKIGSNGIMLSGGQKQRVSVARALYAEAGVMIFDDILSGLDTDTESELFRRVFGPDGLIRRRDATAIVCTHSVRHLPTADHIIALSPEGTVVEEGHFENLMKDPKYVHSLGVKTLNRSFDNSDNETREQDQPDIVKKADAAASAPPRPAATAAMDSALDDRSRQTGDWSVYSHYFNSINKLTLVSLALSALMHGFGDNFGTIWLKFWAEDSFDKSSAFYVGIFALIKTTQFFGIFINARSTFISMAMFAGTVLHKRAITTVITAPLKFFSTTDSGIVTNLFSQDMTLIDYELPNAFTNVSLDLAGILGMVFVIASASPYLAISYPFLFGLIYVIQKFYLRTSRQMRLLDLEAKSPLYTHFLDTIKGIATIRAFDWQDADIEFNTSLLDTSQRPAYLLAVIQRWLMATLQLMVAGLAVVLVALATQLRTNAGLTGASLVTLLSFGQTIAFLIVSYTQLETSIGAVSRLRTFSSMVRPEDQSGEDTEPSEDWPRDGGIEIRDVSASYESRVFQNDKEITIDSPSNLVIKNLTLTIQPRQKVAICGRTGSGKSSLILLLLRLLDPIPGCEQNTAIDGIPFHQLDRATLRQRIIAIPQDAVFLPDGSSIKSNLDPLHAATDAECVTALEAVRLRGFFDDKGANLAAGMSAEDLSAGQKQLFSLGRAILRKRVRDRLLVAGSRSGSSGGILLLDEVSSSVDKVTDRAMQEIIREEFMTYTIIMVSHRLEMVMDFFDRVVVLDKGSLVETGSPRELVDTPGSRFGELWVMGNHELTE